jgi:hypothetical protein
MAPPFMNFEELTRDDAAILSQAIFISQKNGSNG